MNVLEGFTDFTQVVRAKGKRELRSMSLYLNKGVYDAMETLGFRGIFEVNERKVSAGSSNATKLETWKKNLPIEITLRNGVGAHTGDKSYTVNVVLQGYTKDDEGRLIIKIDCPSQLNLRK